MGAIIKEKGQKIKEKMGKKSEKALSFLKRDAIFFIVILIFTSTASFILGRLSSVEKLEFKSETEKVILKREEGQDDILKVVASKRGRVYHLPWCSGAVKIKEENKIFFDSKKAAENAGYQPAKNCEGL
jgi:hypothetical protein